jgi:hypothetical protein
MCFSSLLFSIHQDPIEWRVNWPGCETVHSYGGVRLSSKQAMEAYRVEMLRIPHCSDNRLTDGGEVVI